MKARVLVDPVPHLGTAVERAKNQATDATVTRRRSPAVVEIALHSFPDPIRVLPPHIGTLLCVSEKSRIAGTRIHDVLSQRKVVLLEQDETVERSGIGRRSIGTGRTVNARLLYLHAVEPRTSN